MAIKHQHIEERFEDVKAEAQKHSISEVCPLPHIHKTDLPPPEEHSVIVAKEIERLLQLKNPPQNILAILVDEYQHHAKKPYKDYPIHHILLPKFIHKLTHYEPIALCVVCDLPFIGEKTIANHISEHLDDTKSANGETETIKLYKPVGLAALLEHQPCNKPDHQKNLDNSGKSFHIATSITRQALTFEPNSRDGERERIRDIIINFSGYVFKFRKSPVLSIVVKKILEVINKKIEETGDAEELDRIGLKLFDFGMNKKSIGAEYNQTTPPKTKAGEAPPHVGELMHEVIKEQGLSVYAAAHKIGVNRVFLHNVIKGDSHLSIDVAAKFAAHFSEYSEDELLWAQMKYDQYQYHHPEEKNGHSVTHTEEYTPVS